MRQTIGACEVICTLLPGIQLAEHTSVPSAAEVFYAISAGLMMHPMFDIAGMILYRSGWSRWFRVQQDLLALTNWSNVVSRAALPFKDNLSPQTDIHVGVRDRPVGHRARFWYLCFQESDCQCAMLPPQLNCPR